MEQQDELILGYKLVIRVTKDGTRYTRTTVKGSKILSDSDLGTFGLYLDKMKKDIIDGFKPDAEVVTETDNLLDL